jgi:hypothetical protein
MTRCRHCASNWNSQSVMIATGSVGSRVQNGPSEWRCNASVAILVAINFVGTAVTRFCGQWVDH